MRTLTVIFAIGWLTLGMIQTKPLYGLEVAPNPPKQNPLKPVRTDNPRDTMRTFYEAMTDFRQGMLSGDQALLNRIHDAVRCLNTSELAQLNRQAEAREAAIALKETMDRIIVLKFDLIPEDTTNLLRWRLKDTEITIAPVPEGPRRGEWLFTPETVARAREFFERVQHLPYIKGTTLGAGYRRPWIEEYVPSWLLQSFLGVALWQWTGLFVAILLGLTLRLIVRLLCELLLKVTTRTHYDWDEALVAAVTGPLTLLTATGLWMGALKLLNFTGNVLLVLSFLLNLLLMGSFIWLALRLASFAGEQMKKWAQKTPRGIDDQIVLLISRSLKIFVGVLGVLLAAQNMGIEVFSILAGLGIGGLAVALAAKDTLANFFGSVVVMIDRPFRVGDWVIIGDDEGTVERIGFRSTRIRTFYNSVISVPNSNVVMSSIDNMGMREFRRVRTFVGVTYDTPPEKLEAFLEGIKNALLANPHVRKDYFHVVFHDFGPSSLDIMLYFFLKVPNWSEELVERQRCLLEIIRVAKAVGVDFAFPTQSLHIETFPEKKPVRSPHRVVPDELASVAASFGPGGKESRPKGAGLYQPPYEDPRAR